MSALQAGSLRQEQPVHSDAIGYQRSELLGAQTEEAQLSEGHRLQVVGGLDPGCDSLNHMLSHTEVPNPHVRWIRKLGL